MSVSFWVGDDPARPTLDEDPRLRSGIDKKEAMISARLFMPLGHFGCGRSFLLLVLVTAFLNNGLENGIQSYREPRKFVVSQDDFFQARLYLYKKRLQGLRYLA